MKNSVLDRVFSAEHFSETEQTRIWNQFTRIDFKRNDFLLCEGQQVNHYWFIEKGLVRSFATDPEGEQITTGFYAEAAIVMDWPSFILHQPIGESIQALEDCQCWQIDFKSFETLFHGMEAFRETGRSRLVGSYLSLKQHHLSMITDSAQDRYLKLLKNNPEIVQRAPLKHIASFLGMTDTSLSRIRHAVAKH